MIIERRRKTMRGKREKRRGIQARHYIAKSFNFIFQQIVFQKFITKQKNFSHCQIDSVLLPIVRCLQISECFIPLIADSSYLIII